MTRVRIESFTVSLDGYGAGVDQTLRNPMGVGGGFLHAWALKTRTFRAMFGMEGGSEGEDDRFARRGFDGIGAWVMGRNMFTAERGPWVDPDWKGWWGDVPPYHCEVFVLTTHPRPTLEHGGTTFRFVTGGLHEAMDLARAAADGRDIRVGGGTSTVRQALQAGLVDEMHLAIAHVALGRGEALWPGIDTRALGLELVETAPTADATHHLFRRG